MSVFQKQNLSQKLKVNVKQIQFLNFLYLNQFELDQFVNQEMLENPFLEHETIANNDEIVEEADFMNDIHEEDMYACDQLESESTNFKEHVSTTDADDNWNTLQLERHQIDEDIKEFVMDQVKYFDVEDRMMNIIEFLVYSTNEKGFLDCDFIELVDIISFATGMFYNDEEILEAKSILNLCSPSGFGAFDIQDYLLILIESDLKLDGNIKEKCIDIISNHYSLLVENNWDSIKLELMLSVQEVEEIKSYIRCLKPFPTKGYTNGTRENLEALIPDYQIEMVNGKLKGELINQKSYPLFLNYQYADSLKTNSKNGTNSYVADKLKSGSWLIDAIQQREDTMSKVINALVYLQGDYFLSGSSSKLRPMILKDVAEYIDMNISTVSRVTSNKYAITPIGTINLKELFSEAIYLKNGERRSNKEIQDMVVNLVNSEDKSNPLSDLDIQKILQNESIELTRRTITKYRLKGLIPASKLRKTS